MAITPRDLLTFAKSLLASDGEAELRGAISRAYYAAYHATLPIANAMPSVRVDGGVHLKQVRSLRQCPRGERCATQIKELGRFLDQERLNRRFADYLLDQPISPTLAKDSVDMAERILNLAEFVRERREKTGTDK